MSVSSRVCFPSLSRLQSCLLGRGLLWISFSTAMPWTATAPPVRSRPSFPVPAWVNTALRLLKTLPFRVFPFLPGRPPACSSFHLGSSVLPRDPGLRQSGWIWWQSNSNTCNWEWESVLNGERHRSIFSAVCTNPLPSLRLSFKYPAPTGETVVYREPS